MPMIGQIAVSTFVFATMIIACFASCLRPRLQGREPCPRWFACLVGMIASALVFATWTGMYGLGATRSGSRGFAFGFFVGLIWGGIFSVTYSWMLWRAFDSPYRDYSAEWKQTKNTDLGVLLFQVTGQLRSFRPIPVFASSGMLPWVIFAAAVILPVLWSYGFCQLVWLTEGASG